MTPRTSVIGSALRKLFGSGDIGKYPDPYWNNVVLAMKMNNQIDQYWSKVSALLPLDGTTAIDLKGKTVTASGSAALSATQSVFGGKSLSLNGTTDYITMDAHADFGLGVKDYTIEGWVKTSAVGTILDLRNNAVEYGLFYITAGGYLAHDHTYGTLTGSISVTDNIWHHVVFNRVSGILTMFVDGANAGSFISNANLGSIRQARIGATVAGANFFSGYIDDFRITRGVGRYSGEFSAPKTPCLTGIAQTFLEETGKTVTATNAVTQTTTFKYGNGAAYFDGTGDNIATPSSSDFDFGAGDFTIECWFYVIAASTATLCVRRSTASFAPFSIYTSAGVLGFVGSTNGTTWNIGVTGTTSITTGAWHHMALTRNGSIFSVWLDGVVQGTSTVAGALMASTSPLYVGGDFDLSGCLNGYIDDLRITKGIARYISNFTPPARELSTYGVPAVPSPPKTVIDPFYDNVVLNMHMNGPNTSTAFVDEKGKVITVAGNAQLSTAQSKFGGSSALFDGTGDYLTVPGTSDFVFGTGDFTIEFWINTTDNNFVPLDFWVTGSTAWQIFVHASGYLQWYVSSAIKSGAIPVNTGSWLHVAICRASSSLMFFVNGVMDGTATTDSTNYSTTQSVLSVAAQVNNRNATYDFGGYIDDLRITKGTARYTTNFIPNSLPNPDYKTTPPAVDPYWKNVVLHLSMDGANAGTTFVEKTGKTVTVAGNAQTSTAKYRFGGSSALFDGTNDGVKVATDTSFSIGTGDFTAECWVSAISFTSAPDLISRFDGTSNGWALGLVNDGTVRFSSSAGDNYSSQVLTAGCWYHLALVRVAGVVKIFCNGTQCLSVANPSSFSGASEIAIGCRATGATLSLNGYLDDVRITKGVARYTASFTPPSLPNPTGYDPYAGRVVLHLPMDGADNGTVFTESTGKTVTVAGNTCTKISQYKFGGASAYFDGSGDSLTAPSVCSVSGTGDFTIEFWANPTSFGSGYNVWFANDTPNGFSSSLNSTGTIAFGRSLVATDGTTSNSVVFGQWNHIAFTRSSGTLMIFINGVIGYSAANATSYSSGVVRVGTDGGGSAFPYLGYIDDLRITNGVARYTASFTPPKEPFVLA